MLYEIETMTETEAGETKTSYRLWIREGRNRDCICYFDLEEKPVIESDTLVVRKGKKIKDFDILYFSLHYGDIVEDKKVY